MFTESVSVSTYKNSTEPWLAQTKPECRNSLSDAAERFIFKQKTNNHMIETKVK